MQTPPKWYHVALYALALYLALPIVDGLDGGKSGQEIIFGLIFFFGLFLLFVLLPLRGYPGRVSLFAWNAERPLWSAWWTLLYGSLAVVALAVAWSSLRDGQIWEAIWTIPGVHILLILRSALVATPLSSS